MKKLLAILSALLTAVPVQTPPAFAAGVEDCSKTYKINIDKPYKDGDDAEDTRKKRCKSSGESSGCSSSYNYMWQKYSEYSRRSADICSGVISNQANQTGEGRAAQAEAHALSSDAKTKLEELKKHQEEDMTRLGEMRAKNYSAAEKAVANSDEATKKKTAEYVKKLKDTSALSENDRAKFVRTINQSKLPDAAKDELNAAVDSIRFSTMVGQDAKARGAAAQTLGNAADKTENNEKKSGSSGFGMSDAAGALGLATAGMGLMSALQGQQASSSASDLSPAAPGAAPVAAPTVSSLPDAEVGSASVGSSGGGTSFSGPSDGQSVAKIDATPAEGEHAIPAASMSDPKDSVLSQFEGALGGSPFSGSSTSSGGGAGMAGGSSGGRDPASGESGGSAAAGGAGEVGLLSLSGGLPGFAGGASSSGGGAEASLKDLFKGGDPFAMPALGAGAPGAGADLAAGGAQGGSALESALGFGAGIDAQSGPIPGVNDARNLFTRVKDFHQRCVKKGLVTSEAGGKI